MTATPSSAPDSGGTGRPDRDQRRAALSLRLLEAVDSLAGQGETFTSSSIERLTATAEVGRSTFYLYFRDKSELLLTWLEPIAQDLEVHKVGWARLRGSSSWTDCRQLCEERIAVYRQHAVAVRIVFDASAYDPPLRDAVDALLGRLAGKLTDLIRSGQRQGWIGKSVLAPETATWLTLMEARGGSEIARLCDERRIAGLTNAYARLVHSVLFDNSPTP